MSSESWHNLLWTEEQDMIVDTARKFAEEALAPQAEELDQDARFPNDAIAQLAELGFTGLSVSEEGGGAGMGHVAYFLALQELAKACGSTAYAVHAHSSCASLLERAGRGGDELANLAAGEMLGALAWAEADAGWQVEALATVARKDGDDFVFEGNKSFVANGSVAGLFAIPARLDGTSGRDGLIVALVPKDAPGLTVESVASPLGMRASGVSALSLSGLRVAASSCIGVDGDAASVCEQALASARTGVAAIALGLAEAAYEKALRYSHERIAFGKPLFAKQAVSLKLAEMSTRIEAARHLALHACRVEAAGQPDLDCAARAKVVASEVATYCADEAIQIHGGYGYVSEYDVERIYRDAKVCEIAFGANDACRLEVAARSGAKD